VPNRWPVRSGVGRPRPRFAGAGADCHACPRLARRNAPSAPRTFAQL